MTRFVKAAAALAAVLSAAPARAQISAAGDRAAGIPAGLALPVLGAATAEEPSALGTNPAGPGFVHAPALQWFHEGATRPGLDADGLYGAGRLGPLGAAGSMEWLRPGQGDGARYRRSRLGLSVGDGRALSLGVARTWISSRDGALERAEGWDLGLTARPLRVLSVGAAMLGRDARLGGERLPVRYDLGVAARVLRDGLTLSADLLGDDDARDRLRVTHLTAGAAVELARGLAAAVQVQVPLRDLAGRDRTAGVAALTWNAPHSGWTVGGTQDGSRAGWLAGLRLSAERYRSSGAGRALPTVDLDRELRPRRVLFLSLGDPDPFGALVRRLEAARDDPGVGALLVRVDRLPLGAGRVEELRALLAQVRARKPVLAYLEGGGTKEYWLATGATAVAAPPGAPLLVNGVSSSQLFLRGALARLGITFEVVKAGAYKSATEPLVRDAPSPEAREATEAVLTDVFGRLVEDLAAARRLPAEQVRALVDQGLFTAEAARDAGLLDEVLWPDELEAWGRRVAGRRLHQRARYRPEPERAAQRWGRPPVIEVVRIEGIIAGGRSRREPLGGAAVAGAESVGAAIRRAVEDRDVKAIVLRIESGGGDGLASDLIWREVVRARQRGKPVIASMGDLAASGGYLVAAGADAIVAAPSTLTGSIGVFAAKPDLSGLLGKLSVHREPFTRGENAQLTSLAKPWTPSEREALERQIAAFYDLFLRRVAEGRRLGRGEVEAVAGGRVWTGRQAYERRLVDRLGTLADAVALARTRAGISPGDAVEVRRTGAGDTRLERLAAGAVAALAPEPPLARAARSSPELSALLVLAELGPVLALPEDWLEPAEKP